MRLLLALLCLVGLSACSSPAATPTPSPVAATPQPPVTPLWIDVPSIEARSTLVQLGLNPDKTVEVPPVDKPLQAGWYRNSPAPGEDGPAIVLGHVDGNDQKGIFWRLREVENGDRVEVGRADGSVVAFEVYKVEQIAKDAFPTETVYGNTDHPEIRLITCGGEFDHAANNYLDNILVYGKLVT